MKKQHVCARISCYCEGSEDFECLKIRKNTDVLCVGKKDPDIIDNSIDVDEKPSKASGVPSMIIMNEVRALLLISSLYLVPWTRLW